MRTNWEVISKNFFRISKFENIVSHLQPDSLSLELMIGRYCNATASALKELVCQGEVGKWRAC